MKDEAKRLADAYWLAQTALDEIAAQPPMPDDTNEATPAECRAWLAWHEKWKPIAEARQMAAQAFAEYLGLESTHRMNLDPEAISRFDDEARSILRGK
jgi:hypothetical protein